MPRFSCWLRPALVAVAVLAGGAASAQPMWRPAPEGGSVSLDVLKAFAGRDVVTDERGVVIGDVGPTALNTAHVVSARFPVGFAVTVVADFPTAYFTYDASTSNPGGGAVVGDPQSEFGIGNPYLGAELAARPALTVEAGVRLPLSSHEFSPARFTGIQTSFEAVEMFQDGTFSARLGVRYEPAVSHAIRLRLLAAPVLRTFDSFEQDGPVVQERRATNVEVQYGAQVVGLLDRVELAGGVVGRLDTAGDINHSPVSLTLGASAQGLPVRPGLLIRVPIHDNLFDTDAVVGFSLDVPLR
ncbi:hypothetical protein RQM47_01165 [Rubrivirga sp. S365]|uniref:Transporter n=1 Tax=Rubrivirga litoralis TaxID=3075598 RepID=A0ABU3BSW0_9BACT|nr:MULTISPECIES: hypothetical protein [unclassified Rubrivirga]MDT0632384.1 hypothetical protein [Rubrivirga sp. F394]MDT7855245.1 hypothetical protein [Rubrivirga sp. S365]